VWSRREWDSGRREGEPALMGDEGSSPAATFAAPVTRGMMHVPLPRPHDVHTLFGIPICPRKTATASARRVFHIFIPRPLSRPPLPSLFIPYIYPRSRSKTRLSRGESSRGFIYAISDLISGSIYNRRIYPSAPSLETDSRIGER